MSIQTTLPFTNPTNYTFDSAKVEIDGEASLIGETGQARTHQETFDASGNYTFGSDVEVTGGKAQMVLPNGPDSFSEDFANDTGFTYDSAKAEFTGGLVQTKLQNDAAHTLIATFDAAADPEDADYAAGSDAGTLVGAAAISSGKMEVAIDGSDDYIEYDGASNMPSGNTGCIRFKYTPLYTGSPGLNQYIYSSSQAVNNINSFIRLMQNGTNIRIDIYDSSGVSIHTSQTGNTFNPTSGQTYEFELNWDTTAGQHRLFIDGVLVNGVKSGTGTRGASGQIRLGHDYTNSVNTVKAARWDDLEIFNTVQHTANYTPSTLQIYDSSNVDLPQFAHVGPGAIISLDGFTTTESGSPRYTMRVDANNYKYWTGSAWADSDGTYAQASPKTDVNTNIGTFPDQVGGLTMDVRIHFDDGNVIASVDELTVPHTGDQYYPTTNPTITPNAGLDASSFEGGVTSWDGFTEVATKPTNTEIQYILSDDDGTTWQYWSGSAWVTSNETFAQSNTASVVNTNIGSFSTSADKLLFRAFLSTTDGEDTPQLDTLTVSYTTIGTFATDNPTVQPSTTFRTDTLVSFVETATKPAGSEIKYILTKDSVEYYWTGSAWATSDGTYAQSNTAAEINTNAATFTTTSVAGITVGIKIFLHVDDADGLTPDLDTLVINYELTGDAAVTIEYSSIWGYHKDQNGNALTTPVFVQLEQNAVEYKDQTTIFATRQKVTPNSDGYWEVELVETDNMAGEQHYIFEFDGLRLKRKVPNEASNNFWDLTK